MQDFRLEKYLSDGVERILRGILRVSDPRGSFFMLKFMAAEKRARRLREIAEEGRAYSAIFNCKYYESMQSSLQRMLCQGQRSLC